MGSVPIPLDLAAAIVRINLLKGEPWRFDAIGQAAVEPALEVVLAALPPAPLQGDQLAKLRSALADCRRAITNENGLNGQSIVCTVWNSGIETLVDRIDAALQDEEAQP